jgi:hypothetical protein
MIDYRSVGTPPRRQRLIASAGLDADPVVWAYKKDKEKAPAAVELETANPVKVRTHVCLSLPPSLPPRVFLGVCTRCGSFKQAIRVRVEIMGLITVTTD